MSRFSPRSGIVISSHGYVEYGKDVVGLFEVGFDQFGGRIEEGDVDDEGFVDLDMTWPDWWQDPRLLAAVDEFQR